MQGILLELEITDFHPQKSRKSTANNTAANDNPEEQQHDKSSFVDSKAVVRRVSGRFLSKTF